MSQTGDNQAEVLAEIAAARAAMATAFQTILDASDAALAAQPLTTAAERAIRSIVIACAAEDIVGQRLARAGRLLEGGTDDPLLRGPAFAGQGLNQAMADALFADHDGAGG